MNKNFLIVNKNLILVNLNVKNSVHKKMFLNMNQ